MQNVFGLIGTITGQDLGEKNQKEEIKVEEQQHK